MSHLVVLPSIDEQRTVVCLASWTAPGPVIVVDNTVANRGVPASWNIGARWVQQEGYDWLVVLSAGVVFGEPGGQDFIDQLDRHPDAIAVEADGGLGWHCIAFSARSLNDVGLFDSRFYPAYYEDNDWAYRAYCHYKLNNDGPWWPKVKVDVGLVEVAHGLKRAHVKVDMMGNRQKYIDKHGGEPGKEAFRATWGACPTCGEVYEACRCRR